MRQNKIIKTTAIILLSVCTVFVIIYFSVFSVVHAEHAEHSCDTPDCCICRQLNMAGNIINKLEQARTPVLLLLVAVMASRIRGLPVQTASARTLVSEKVRLNR